jgi:hypothetical protein
MELQRSGPLGKHFGNPLISVRLPGVAQNFALYLPRFANVFCVQAFPEPQEEVT